MPKNFFFLEPKKGVNLGGCKSGARLYSYIYSIYVYSIIFLPKNPVIVRKIRPKMGLIRRFIDQKVLIRAA